MGQAGGWARSLARGPRLPVAGPGRRARRALRPSAGAHRGQLARVRRDGAGGRGPRSGFALDPDADRLAIVDEKGRYIGEELTLALAAARRLGQEKGPVILNLSTSRVTETLARAAGCVVFRTPVGEINVVQRMVDVNAVLGGEGNGGVIDPRVGYVRDSFVGMAMVLDLMAATGEPLSNLVAGSAAVRDGQGAVSAGRSEPTESVQARAIPPPRSPRSGTGLPTPGPTREPIAATDCVWSGTIAGFTSARATPSRSCG